MLRRRLRRALRAPSLPVWTLLLLLSDGDAAYGPGAVRRRCALLQEGSPCVERACRLWALASQLPW